MPALSVINDGLARSSRGCHCEEGSDEAIPNNQLVAKGGDCFPRINSGGALTGFCIFGEVIIKLEPGQTIIQVRHEE